MFRSIIQNETQLKKNLFQNLNTTFFETSVHNDNFIVKDCEIFLDDAKGKPSLLNRNILRGH